MEDSFLKLEANVISRLVNLTEWRWPKVMVEYDRNQETWFVWTWPKTDNDEVHLVNMTDNNWVWPKISKNKNNATMTNMYCWIWPKIVNKIYFRSYSLLHVCRCGDDYCIFGFRSCSTGNVHRHGNFYFKFQSSSPRERSWLSAFGHVHRFRSYSLCHLH